MVGGIKFKDKALENIPSPEFLSFAQAQLEILPSPTRGEGIAWETFTPLRGKCHGVTKGGKVNISSSVSL